MHGLEWNLPRLSMATGWFFWSMFALAPAWMLLIDLILEALDIPVVLPGTVIGSILAVPAGCVAVAAWPNDCPEWLRAIWLCAWVLLLPLELFALSLLVFVFADFTM